MKKEILSKLYSFLDQHQSIQKEHEVVYIMVELRKLLDREKIRDASITYPIVRFYADWTVHTRKDIITKPIREIMKSIDESLNPYPKDGNIDFLSMPELRKELIKLLQDYKLPAEFAIKDSNWRTFLLTLIEVLVDQPIINPTDNISEFYYVGINRKGIMATINFRGKKEGESITVGHGLW